MKLKKQFLIVIIVFCIGLAILAFRPVYMDLQTYNAISSLHTLTESAAIRTKLIRQLQQERQATDEFLRINETNVDRESENIQTTIETENQKASLNASAPPAFVNKTNQISKMVIDNNNQNRKHYNQPSILAALNTSEEIFSQLETHRASVFAKTITLKDNILFYNELIESFIRINTEINKLYQLF